MTTTTATAVKRTPMVFPAGNATTPATGLSCEDARLAAICAVRAARAPSEARLSRSPGLWNTMVVEQRHVANVREKAARRLRLQPSTAKLAGGQEVCVEWARTAMAPMTYRATNLRGDAQAVVVCEARQWEVTFPAASVAGRLGLGAGVPARCVTLADAKAFTLGRIVAAIEQRLVNLATAGREN